MCHHNTFLIYGSIVDASQKKWEIITHASILTSLIVACLFGIAGYATFKAYSQGLFFVFIWPQIKKIFIKVSRTLQLVQMQKILYNKFVRNKLNSLTT